MTYPVCPHCRQRIINPGGHAEACTGPGPQCGAENLCTLPHGHEGDHIWRAADDRFGPTWARESPVQVELAPDHEIDPTTQVDRTPGIDAVCQKVGPEGYAPDCGFPFCDCFVRGGS